VTTGEPVSLHIEAGRGAYPVHVEPGCLARSWELLEPVLSGRRVAVITQRRLRRLYGRKLTASWPAEVEPLWLEVPQGEKAKTLRWLERLCARLARAGMTRGDAIVALGGGVVGDLAGFVAASWMRGVRWVQVPTSLLAQVDSSVGGKVAVNLPQGKNLVGAFYPPDVVLMDPDTLGTLPRRELLAGCAEVAKYGLIRDASFFARCEEELPEPADWVPILVDSVRHKAEVVAADEREKGERMSLNLGHTMGHALEAAGRYSRLVHGEAVNLGIRYVYRLARHLGTTSDEDVARVDALFAGGLRGPSAPRLAPDGLLATMRRDKKADAGGIRWVLPVGVGAWRLEAGVDDELVARTYQELVDHDRKKEGA
jgi:3-dehydroquinate synthase